MRLGLGYEVGISLIAYTLQVGASSTCCLVTYWCEYKCCKPKALWKANV